MKPPPVVNEEGTIEAISQGEIKMVSKVNQPVRIMILPATVIHLTGTASPDYIRKGVYVQFTADVDSKHAVKEKISHLTVFTPTREKGAGLISADAPEAMGAPDSTFPAQDTGTGKSSKHTGTSSHKSSGNGHKPPAPVKLPATCIVRGQVKSCTSGNLVIVAGRGGKIEAVMADDAAIRVDVADLSAASKGDAITVQGRSMPAPPTRPGMAAPPSVVLAETVNITAAQPLVGGKKKHSRADRSTTKPAPRSPKKTPDDQAPTAKGAG
jgi:hypothetical protein